jgi:hypothetical protein
MLQFMSLFLGIPVPSFHVNSVTLQKKEVTVILEVSGLNMGVC